MHEIFAGKHFIGTFLNDPGFSSILQVLIFSRILSEKKREMLISNHFFFPNNALCPLWNIFHHRGISNPLKVALQILGRKFYKNTKKSSLCSQSLFIFIHKTPVVENHPTTGEIRDLHRRKSQSFFT